MLDLVPDVVLHNVLKHLDRDEIRFCRQVNRRVRSYIDCHRTLYPKHPASVQINCEDSQGLLFLVELRSDWTKKLISRKFRILSYSMEGDRKGNYSGLVEAFLNEEEPDEPIDVSFGVPFFREVLCGILDRYDISNLELKGATVEMMCGVTEATYRRGPRREIPYVYIFMAEDMPLAIPAAVFYFCHPTRLTLCNFPTSELKDYLANQTVRSVKDLRIEFRDDVEDFPPEVFLGVKCEKLLIDSQISMSPEVLNGILKQWCNGERNFAKEDAWYLITKHETFDDFLDLIFQGLPVQMCEAGEGEEDMRGVPIFYFKITRSGCETITVFFEEGRGLGAVVRINAPTEDMW